MKEDGKEVKMWFSQCPRW